MDTEEEVDAARQRWSQASADAASFAAGLFQPGSGYGDPDALLQDQHRLESLRAEAERLFREYQEIDRRLIGHQMMELQRSQRLAAWCSFGVAAVVGVATVASIVEALLS